MLTFLRSAVLFPRRQCQLTFPPTVHKGPILTHPHQNPDTNVCVMASYCLRRVSQHGFDLIPLVISDVCILCVFSGHL